MRRLAFESRTWRFVPPWWAVALALGGSLAALGLGQWQLQRAEAKRELLQHYLEAAMQPPQVLDAGMPGTGQPRAVTARGLYAAQRQLLLDNQTQGERPGHHVWTPLRLESGALVLVDRGWIPQFARREQPAALPVPDGPVEIRGLWRSLPRAALQTPAPPCAPAAGFPHYVVYPQAAELGCLLGEPVADGVLLLDPQAPGGYVREWHFAEAIPPERHIGYAVQWFAIALAIFILFLKLNFKRVPSHD